MNRLLTVAVFALAIASPAPAAQYVVAPGGDDSGPGSARQPFRTIQKAADVMEAGDVCRIRGGVYRETVTVKTSGRAGRTVRFVAQAGETVTLSGAEPIRAKWAVHKGRIYKARLGQDVGQLFVDGEMMVEARWPNQPLARRWDKATWRTTAEGSDYGKIVDPALADTGVDWTGGLAVLNVGAWQTFLRPVRNHAAGRDTFEYAKDMGRRHEAARTKQKRRRPGFDRYFLYGKLEALDSPGEWFFDRKSRVLYLWPPDGEDPTGRRIEGKVRSYAFLASGRARVRIEGLRFFATTLALEKANDCLIADCELSYPTYVMPSVRLDGSRRRLPARLERAAAMFLGGRGVLAATLIEGSRNTVRNCRISFSEAPGLLLAGLENTVENCLIHDLDWRGLGNGVAPNCGAVHMGQSGRSTIRRCTVHHFGSSEGIILSGLGPSLCEYNYVHHGGIVQSDGGLIQCSGLRLAGTVIRHNWVHDHLAFVWGGVGIRGDDLTRNLLIHHNVAFRCREKAVMIKGDRNQAYHNTCFDNPTLDMVLWSSPEPFKEWATRQHAHLIEKQNAHSKAYNNYAPVLTGQMHHEVRRARKVIPPVSELSHNLGARSFTLLDPKKLTFRKDAAPLTDPTWLDFRPAIGSPMIDAGRVIEGFSQAHVGEAPDIGAYERGAKSYWIPGYQPPRASMPIPPSGASSVRRRAELIWLPGYKAIACDVYFGTDAKAVAAAGRASPQYRGRQSHNIFALPPLEARTRYSWRIDAVTPAGTVKGGVWQFTSAE